MTTKTLPDRKIVSSDKEDIPGFPSLKRDPVYQYTTADIAWILRGGEKTDSTGRKSCRAPMSTQAAKNWLTGAHAKGEIDAEQVWRFWPDDTLPDVKRGEG